MKEIKHIKVGEMEIPVDYWDLTEADKMDICLALMDSMLIILDKNLNTEINRMDVLDKLLQSSIMVNEAEENYEICEVMQSIRNIIHE